MLPTSTPTLGLPCTTMALLKATFSSSVSPALSQLFRAPF